MLNGGGITYGVPTIYLEPLMLALNVCVVCFIPLPFELLRSL